MATSKAQDVHLKVFVKGKEDKIFYCFMPISYNDLKSTIQNMLVEDVSKMRIYWIDADGDEIIIDSYMAYNIFIQMAEKKKVFVESEMKEPPHKVSFVPTTDEKPQLNEKREHKDVECDGCGECPIVGFRYKCVQCSNFDLCMKCEGKMMHKQHVMFRLPEPLKRGGRRISLKKYKKEFARSESDCGDEPCSRNDRHRHNRRSSHGGKQNFISHLYTMMHDLAEGTEIPIDEPTMTSENTSTSTAQNHQPSNTKNENNTSNTDNKNERTENQPKGININFDPNYAKVGIQVMNNISDMFAKMFDPLNVEIDLGVDLNDKNVKKTDKENKNNETSNDLNPDNEEKQKDSENENLKQNERKNSVDVDTSSSSGQADKDKVIDENIKPTTHEQAEKKRDSVNDEGNDWTLVDKSIEKESTPNYNKNDDGAIGGFDENMTGLTVATAPCVEAQETGSKVVDYAKLSKDLLQHLKKENKQPEMRAQIVYHPKPHINNAIIAMIAMGFSNEGNWLTHLLESVDGDISQALDLMKPVK